MWLSWVAAALLAFQAASPAEEGLKALDEERYADAAQVFESMIEADSENYGAHFNLAFAYTMLGRAEEAVSGYKKVLELKPGLYQAEINLGVLLLDRQNTEEAVPHLKAAAEQKPDEFRPNYYLARALYDSADDPGAEKYYAKAAQIDPAAPDVQIGLGRALANQGRFDEAAPYYRRAGELDPGYRDFLIELASRYEEQGKKAPAIAIYKEFTGRPEVEERLGHLLLQTGKVEEALPHLISAVSKSPTTANRYALATAYVKSGQPDKALPLLELTLTDQPDNFEMRMVHGRLLRDQRQFGPAAQDFLRAVQTKPESKEAWNELASMLILLENYPQALAALDKVESLGDAPTSIHFFRGMIWDKAKEHEKAIASYQRFLELSQEQFPDEEFKARQRIIVLKREMRR